jgi:hypothetical protein
MFRARPSRPERRGECVCGVPKLYNPPSGIVKRWVNQNADALHLLCVSHSYANIDPKRPGTWPSM